MNLVIYQDTLATELERGEPRSKKIGSCWVSLAWIEEVLKQGRKRKRKMTTRYISEKKYQ